MIELVINGMTADVPADFTLPMTYENELFTNSSEYSLDVTLPLKGSANNQKIFGHINRVTTPKEETRLEVVCYANGRTVGYGYAILLSITDETVTIQIAGNTSYINYIAADKYIDELDLGLARNRKPTWKTTEWNSGQGYVKQEEYPFIFGSVDDCDMPMFWAYYKDPATLEYETSAPGFRPQRYPNSPYPSFPSSGDGSAMLMTDFHEYSCQPYLLVVLKRVMNALGFKIKRDDIAHTWLRHLYICSYREAKDSYQLVKWPDDGGTEDGFGLQMAQALPHWSVASFIDEIEKLCACVFLFNTHNKTVDIIQLNKFYDETTHIHTMPDDKIVDEYEVDIDESSEDKDLAGGNIHYNKEYTDQFLKVQQEVLDYVKTKVHCENFASVQTAYDGLSTIQRKETLLIDDETGREYICFFDDKEQPSLMEVNVFGALSRSADAPDVTLNIVPANTRKFNVGWWFDEASDNPSAAVHLNVPFSTEGEAEPPKEQTAQELIESNYSGEKKSTDECMEVMLSTGEYYHLATYSGKNYNYPVPFTDFNMEGSTKGKLPQMSLSLKDVCEDSLGHLYRNIPNYHSRKKFAFKFLSPTVPDVRSIFLLHNQRYVARCLSSTYTMADKEFLFEGEFYRLE